MSADAKNGRALPPCSKTDAVLALYLDGDVDGPDGTESGFDFACTDSLAEHRRDCRVCQWQLQRARRLDAVLAENSGRVVAHHAAAHGSTDGGLDELAARWCRAERLLPARLAPERSVTAMPSAKPVARPAAASASRPRSSTVAASLAGIGLVVATWCGGRAAVLAAPAIPAASPSAALAKNARAAPAVEPTIRVADDAARRRTHQLADAREVPGLVPFDRAAEQRRLVDQKQSPGARVAAAKLLLQAARPGSDGADAALASLTEVLAASQPGAAGCAAMVAIHAAAEREFAFLTHVRAVLQRLDHPRSPFPHGLAGLDDLAALTVAARLDRRDLDAAVLRAVRRHPELSTVLAAALRSGIRQRGTAGLLLDAWGDLTARGTLADDERAATLWFAGQSAATFEEVRAELDATRSAPRRVRCLLAFGSCPDDQSLAVLVAWTGAGCRDEAHAAAYALAQQSSRVLRPLVAKALQQREAFLLRAALARARLPEAEAWVAPLSLGRADRALLTGCTFARFPIVAAWFRDQPGPLAGPLASGD